MNAGSGILEHIGIAARAQDPGLLVAGGSRDDFENLADLFAILAKDFPRLSLHLCVNDSALRSWVRARFPGLQASVLPPGFPGMTDMFLNRSKARTLIVPDKEFPLSDGLVSAMARRGVNMVCVRPAGAGFSTAEIFSGAPERDPPPVFSNVQDTAKTLARHVGRERHLRNELKSTAWLPSVLSRFVRKIDGAEELAKRLGYPKTILCLGNGPSSEDPCLKGLSHDVLFRTNHIWLKRGFLTRPDVVFTGLRATMRKVHGAIFGIYGSSWEKVFMMQRAFKLHRGPVGYFLTDGFGKNQQNRDEKNHWPTAGAIMVSVAVDLQPEKLIIAGIDMFQHAQGTYPGDESTPNDFAPAHSFNRDRAHVMNSLERYNGELVIISDVLNREWQAHKALKSA